MLIFFDITGLIFGVLGAILLGNKLRVGFLSFIVGSIAHGLLGFLTGNYGLMCASILFVLIDIYYYRKWGRV